MVSKTVAKHSNNS